jgi:hypothetical protein
LADPAGDSVSIRGCLRWLSLEVYQASNDRHRSLARLVDLVSIRGRRRHCPDLEAGLVSNLDPRCRCPDPEVGLVSNRDRHRRCPDLEVGLVSRRGRRRHSDPWADLVSSQVFGATIPDPALNADASGGQAAPADRLYSSSVHPWTTGAYLASRGARPDVAAGRAAPFPPLVPAHGLALGLRDPREPGLETTARESDVSSRPAGF